MAVTYDVDNVAHTLNDLVQTCIDGQKGFESAANAIDDPSLKSELMGYSAQRRDFANDLQNLVASFGDRPTQSGSVSGALHRGWINLRDAVTTRDSYAILAECERGEDAAVAEYRKAAEANLPAEFDQVVESQFAAVQATHDRIKSLRDSFKRS
jgi:uncharacterized protein (TIGR02284 family)